eukprot:403351227
MTLDPKNHLMPHPIYQLKDIEKLNFTHRKPADFTDRLALTTVKNFRRLFDLLTGYNQDRYSGRLWLNRVIFLETIAGVPGMCGGMTIHLKSLRTLKPDRGFIHYLLEEAENERTHLFLFMNYKNPSYLFRAMIAMGQGVFWNFYFLWYLISPRFCHRFVGYLEEEAVHTYSIFLKQMDAGYLPEFNVQASKMARDYYQLSDDATFRDMVLSIRADESVHREFNHYFSDLKPDEEIENLQVYVTEENDEQVQNIKLDEEISKNKEVEFKQETEKPF